MTTTPTSDLTRSVDGRNVPAPGIWAIDPTHTEVAFTARHLMVTKVRGSFTDVAGTIEVADDPTDSKVEVVIGTASVSSGTEDRDNHLRSPDFLNVEAYPEMRFVSTSVDRNGDEWTMTGELTIREVTKAVTLDVDFLGVMVDPWGNPKAAFSATTTIDREEWDLTWNVALETGGVLVSKKVELSIEVQAAPSGN